MVAILKVILFLMLPIFVLACTGKETRSTYYPSGKLETISEVKGFKKDGQARIYFESGELEYEGNYKNDLKDGWHISYYENGKVNEKTLYRVLDNRELASEKLVYNKTGDLELDFKYEIKVIDVTFSKPPPYKLNDTIRAVLSIKNAKHKYCAAVAGKFDENLNLLDDPKMYSDEISGNENHEIKMRLILVRPGWDTLTWLVRDFDYTARTDSTGLSVGEESFAKAVLNVLP